MTRLYLELAFDLAFDLELAFEFDLELAGAVSWFVRLVVRFLRRDLLIEAEVAVVVVVVVLLVLIPFPSIPSSLCCRRREEHLDGVMLSMAKWSSSSAMVESFEGSVCPLFRSFRRLPIRSKMVVL